jgi:hypothetical protein
MQDSESEKLTPEQKDAAKRRVAPLLELLLAEKIIANKVAKLTLVVVKDGFDAEDIYREIVSAMREKEEAEAKALEHVCDMLARYDKRTDSITDYDRDAWVRRMNMRRRMMKPPPTKGQVIRSHIKERIRKAVTNHKTV